jgi:hypothetical protein
MRLQMEALSRAQFVPAQMASLMTSGMAASPFAFFSANAAAQPARAGNVIDISAKRENQDNQSRVLNK